MIRCSPPAGVRANARRPKMPERVESDGAAEAEAGPAGSPLSRERRPYGLTRTRRPPPAAVQARTLNASDGAIFDTTPLDYDDPGARGAFPVAVAAGRLHIYRDPADGLRLLEPVVTNGPACQTITVIRIPPTTQARPPPPPSSSPSRPCAPRSARPSPG
jgi:hypothetical protein